MLKTLRLRRFLGALAAILGVAALAFAADPPPPPPGACSLEDDGWATADGGCKDLVANKVWSLNVVDEEHRTLTWDLAVRWCQARVEGGYSDWRLPTIAEGQAAVQHNIAPHLNTLWYYNTWTSQSRGNKAYNIDLKNATTTLFPKNSGIVTYCVRP